MQYGTNELAAVAEVVDGDTVGARAEEFLHQRLTGWQRIEGPQKTGEAKHLRSGAAEFEALPSPDAALHLALVCRKGLMLASVAGSRRKRAIASRSATWMQARSEAAS
ncbi:hypothetical protein [Methylobacterium sp. Leaf94]|uniref:hypothetical protein n=1 Tax=Methylobacterium sp. Leaf94 TaxID=1736250 RepID=UPI000AD1D9BA|nr:hypothetical protein [Methylobacterium sp. Leaf94]